MQSKHILPLTGIRLFAATWVVTLHFKEWLIQLCPFLQPLAHFFDFGGEAVPLFFLLSGFILSYNYFPNYSFGEHPKFLFFRFARLWPVHFATLLLMILGPDLINFNGSTFKSIFEELLMIRSWLHDNLALNYPAWSISVEFFAYVFIFPLAFFTFRRIQSWPLLVVMVTLLLAGQVYLPLTVLPGKCGSIPFLFLAGSGLYRIYFLLKNPPAELIVVSGLILLVSYVSFDSNLSKLVLYGAFALLIFGLAYERGFLARILSTKIAVQGGLASYSLYMTHALILRTYLYFTWDKLPQSAFLRFFIFLILVGVLAGTAFTFHHYLEEPANKKLRAFATKLQTRIKLSPE